MRVATKPGGRIGQIVAAVSGPDADSSERKLPLTWWLSWLFAIQSDEIVGLLDWIVSAAEILRTPGYAPVSLDEAPSGVGKSDPRQRRDQILCNRPRPGCPAGFAMQPDGGAGRLEGRHALGHE